MRFTALLTELIFLFPPIYLLISKNKNVFLNLTLFFILIKPDVILIDHGHFQYNSLILGLILYSFYFIVSGRFYLCCLLYTVSIHAKQMAVYYSLAFFAGLIGVTLRSYRFNRKKIYVEIMKYGCIVIGLSMLIWSPWLSSFDSFKTVLTAIFPIHRGLYQLKVPNFWCISDLAIKW
jgi:alpha-1,3-glucosyltransferase